VSALLQEIRLQAAGNEHLQHCLVAAAAMEGGNLQGPWPRGDAGCAAGPFQIRWWMNPCDAAGTWKGHRLSAAEAEDPAVAVAYAIRRDGLNFTGAAAQYPNVIDAVFAAERPSRYYSEAQQAAAHAAIAAAFGDLQELTMPDKPQIAWVGAHASNYAVGRIAPDGRRIAPEAWVNHIAEGSFAGLASWFNLPADQHVAADGTFLGASSTHFSVAKDGRIQQHVLVTNTAFGNGGIETGYTAALIDENGGINPNLWTVSCEHEGFTGEAPTQAMFDASTRLCAWVFASTLIVSGASDVTVDAKHILRHGSISPQSRLRCPGWSPSVFSDYIARVQFLMKAPVPPPIDFRAIAVRALRDIVLQADHDEQAARLSAELRRQDARARLAALGEAG
jgi:hypothetical protein